MEKNFGLSRKVRMFGHLYLYQLQLHQNLRHMPATSCTRCYRRKKMYRLRMACTVHLHSPRTTQQGMVCTMHLLVKICDLHHSRRTCRSPRVHTYPQHTVSSSSSHHRRDQLDTVRMHDSTKR